MESKQKQAAIQCFSVESTARLGSLLVTRSICAVSSIIPVEAHGRQNLVIRPVAVVSVLTPFGQPSGTLCSLLSLSSLRIAVIQPPLKSDTSTFSCGLGRRCREDGTNIGDCGS